MQPRLLETHDLDSLMALKETANWNQTRQDWINVMRLSPAGCFALDLEGKLAATATAVCFGDTLAWIGMVLTLPEFRGRGLARCLMEHSIEWIESRGVDWIKLDATDMGRPLYSKLGFEDECVIERWYREADPAREAVDLSPDAGEPRLDLDARAVGADRSELLRLIAPLGCVALPEGYAMGRPGSKASYLGPCVTSSLESARLLLRSHLARHAGQGVYWDILETNPAALHLAREFGFSPLRRLIRMARPGRPHPRPLLHDDSLVFAIAGFEFG